MNCRDVKDLMSAYYDGELSAETASAVRLHIEACPDCSAEIRVFQRLSRLASALTAPTPPDRWSDLARALGESPASVLRSPRSKAGSHSRRRLIGAACLITLGVLLLAVWFSRHAPHPGGEFDAFLVKFQESPEAADRFLAERYRGRPVATEEAEKLLKYRPAITRGVPAGYALESMYVVRMPCCTCLQANLRRDSGGWLVLFEHDSLQAEWFEDRPTITAVSQGGPTRLTQIDGALAASCPHKQRRLTLVGARDLAEVDRLLEFWVQDSASKAH